MISYKKGSKHMKKLRKYIRCSIDPTPDYGEYWEAVGRYDDGTEIVKYFPYDEDGNSSREEGRQYDIESWLIDAHPGCNFYSVNYVNF